LVCEPTATPKKEGTENKSQKWNDRYAAFGPSTWSNWALFLAGAAAGLAALRSLGTINRQAELAETTLQISHRPWLVPTDDMIINDNTVPVTPDAHGLIKIQLPILNTEFGEIADRDDLNVTMIGPDLKRRLTLSIGGRKATETEEPSESERAAKRKEVARVAAVLNGGIDQPRFWLYGFIEYRDGFKKEPAYGTTFSFYWQPVDRCFVMSGPYNHCT